MFNGTAGQHNLTVTLTAPSDAGIYTCVVNTEFKSKETNTSIGFKIVCKWAVSKQECMMTYFLMHNKIDVIMVKVMCPTIAE